MFFSFVKLKWLNHIVSFERVWSALLTWCETWVPFICCHHCRNDSLHWRAKFNTTCSTARLQHIVFSAV